MRSMAYFRLFSGSRVFLHLFFILIFFFVVDGLLTLFRVAIGEISSGYPIIVDVIFDIFLHHANDPRWDAYDSIRAQ